MAKRTSLPVLMAGLLLAGCDLSGDILFSPVDGLPATYEITGPDGGPLVPATVRSLADIRANTIYGELGPPETSRLGGATFTFLGTGGNVCIWVDPEVAAWNTSISDANQGGSSGAENGARWDYPDNPFDDGDIDITAGLSVYYTGSPGSIGDFEVNYEDSLGNEVNISLAGCPAGLSDYDELEFAGKGQPEFCTLSTVGAEGVSHTVVLQSFSVPSDDSRLAYGLLLARGTCSNLFGVSGVPDSSGGGGLNTDPDPLTSECLIVGEALEPIPLEGDEDDYLPIVGYDNALSHMSERSMAFEQAYCFGSDMASYCEDEAEEVTGAGLRCTWENFEADAYDPAARCYCGDPNDIPDAAAF